MTPRSVGSSSCGLSGSAGLEIQPILTRRYNNNQESAAAIQQLGKVIHQLEGNCSSGCVSAECCPLLARREKTRKLQNVIRNSNHRHDHLFLKAFRYIRPSAR